MTYPEAPYFQGTVKDQGVGGGPSAGNIHPFPKITRIIFPKKGDAKNA